MKFLILAFIVSISSPAFAKNRSAALDTQDKLCTGLSELYVTANYEDCMATSEVQYNNNTAYIQVLVCGAGVIATVSYDYDAQQYSFEEETINSPECNE